MKYLAEIHRSEGVKIRGRAIQRTAVRGVALRGGELLMVYSAAVGDYKFPGGGVQPGESHGLALKRELREECGCRLLRLGRRIGAVVEYNHPHERDYDVFKMTSHYYYCSIAGEGGEQSLDDYERTLGFLPMWVSLEEALRQNRSLLGSPEAPDWLRREIFMLEYLGRMGE